MLAIAMAFTLSAPTLAKTRQQIAIEQAIKRRPMAFFLAKGEPNACGSGCSEWIAADGVIDPEAATRFKAFLDGLKRSDLPVFINSSGGSVSQSMLIGIMLREQRMTVGVGRTLPDGCRRISDDACRHLMQSKPEHKAHFRADGALCNSACVYALLGGWVRKISRNAKVGIHTVFAFAARGDRVPSDATVDKANRALRRYAVEMGVDSSLIDAAGKISSNRIHVLTGDELRRYGIETGQMYETPWTLADAAPLAPSIVKLVTEAKNPREYRATKVHLFCADAQTLRLDYERESSPAELAAPVSVSVASGDQRYHLTRRLRMASPHAGWTELLSAAIPMAFFGSRSGSDGIVVTEDKDRSSDAVARTLKLSTAGLARAVEALRPACRYAS